mmetsp:Transcript_42867/g.100554  ORF Transcript_42867/g.100554 Transcript_42867/m.100554 type:complete len:917 (-) Transcript_42867:60-2810(-)
MLAAATATTLSDPADRANWSDILGVLRSKDETLGNLQHALEIERKQRRELQVQTAAEKSALQQHFQQEEADLRRRLQDKEEDFEQHRDAFSVQHARLAEQLQDARLREAVLLEKGDVQSADLTSLLSRVELDQAELNALRMRLDATAAELQEAQAVVLAGDKIQKAILHELEEKDALLEVTREELKEAQSLERSMREQSQAQSERLSTQCSTLSRQLQTKEREADVLEERCKRLEEASTAKELQTSYEISELKQRCKQLEATLAKTEEECKGFRPLEAAMRERVHTLELQLEDQKCELQKARQELFREQSTTEAKELAGQALNRDKNMLRDQLQAAHDDTKAAQEELRHARARVRALESELEEKKASLAVSEQRTLRFEEAEKPLQEQLTKQSAELSRAAAEVTVGRGKLEAAIQQHDADVRTWKHNEQKLLAEISAAQEQRTLLSMQLAEAQNKVTDLKAAATEMQSKHEEELAQACAKPLSADKEVFTSPRMAPLALRDTQHWRAEMAALHRSVASMQAVVRMPPHSGHAPGAAAGASAAGFDGGLHLHAQELGRQAGDCARTAVRLFVERCVDRLYRRSLLWDVWQMWLLHLQVADIRAQLDLALSDELKASRDRRQLLDGGGDSLAERLPDTTMATLKDLLAEFRHRTSAFVGDLSPVHEGSEAPSTMAAALSRGRDQFGRFFHAALFLYQKLRSLVASELREQLQDPLCQLVPLPFYVLPYKLQNALRTSSAAMVRGVRGSGTGGLRQLPGPPDAADPDAWFKTHIHRMEEHLPLSSRSPAAVPRYLCELLSFRDEVKQRQPRPGTLQSDSESSHPLEVHWRDRTDVLLVDALTVFMSAWRINQHANRTASRGDVNTVPAVLQRLPPEMRSSQQQQREATSPDRNSDARAASRSASPPRWRELQLGPRPSV